MLKYDAKKQREREKPNKYKKLHFSKNTSLAEARVIKLQN